MKFLHLADLHLGKRVNDFSMIEDQEFILNQILEIAENEKIDATVIAGDVYDKSTPNEQAVSLLDSFLVSLSNLKIKVFLIAGNHDSAERLSFGCRLMEASGLHISKAYDGKIETTALEDDYGKINFYLLPFIKPAHIRSIFNKETETYTEAVNEALKQINLNKNERNVLITHQFVTGSSKCDSEDFSVGGSDNVDSWVFDDFDYVALGHIHSPQKIGRETLRYSGTPLKYSFSECNHKKSACLVEMNEKGNIKINLIPLKPLHDMREIKGKFSDILTGKEAGVKNSSIEDYLHITLTDENDIPDALARLRLVYPRIMKLDYDNERTRNSLSAQMTVSLQKKSPVEIFSDFFETQNGNSMNENQYNFINNLINSILAKDEHSSSVE
ncbi:exonuclease SbcCD subunit D [Treponema sp.]|uniref:exonuclease SbcCD subunit D n=1 Tax=Treponema sp. TaxID=166 RepID=UPI00388E75DD